MSRSCNCALTLHASKETSERIAQNGIATQEGGVSECGVKSSTLQAFGKLWVMQLGLKSLFCELHPLFQFISSFPLWYSANFHLLAPITNGESRGGGGTFWDPSGWQNSSCSHNPWVKKNSFGTEFHRCLQCSGPIPHLLHHTQNLHCLTCFQGCSLWKMKGK